MFDKIDCFFSSGFSSGGMGQVPGTNVTLSFTVGGDGGSGGSVVVGGSNNNEDEAAPQ